MQGQPRTPRFDEYLAGAFFGYTMSTIPIIAMSYFFPTENINPSLLDPFLLAALIIGSNFAGGALGGYVVARRAATDFWKVGVKTGLGCLVMNGFITRLLTGETQSLLALATIFSGSIFGSWLLGITRRKAEPARTG